MPIPGPRPRPRQVPPPPATIVRPRVAGRSSVPSEPAEGPLLAGISVTVFPGRSSRSLRGVAAAVAGWATGSGSAMTGVTRAGAERGVATAASRATHRAGRTLRRCIRGCRISSGEAIFASGVWVTRVRSRWGSESAACGLPPDRHAPAATRAVSGSRKRVRMNPPGV
jgi:hypothetical protein